MEGFSNQYSEERAQREKEEMQKKIDSGAAHSYEEAEELVEQDKAARDKAAREGRTYSVDTSGVVLTDEERKQRIEEGPDSHANQR